MRSARVRVLSHLLMLVLAGCSHQARTENLSYGGGNGGYSDAGLDQMLAPIALYPDSLLSQILMAATYPREVEEAADWSRRNPRLSGAAAVDAVDHMDWDPSVKALAAFPQVLDQMARDMDWTQRLGDAYLMQESAVIDSIQRLRDHAYRAGSLADVEHVRVIRDGGIYVIEPASVSLVYVPYYPPLTIYGNWWWPDYPPYYWGPPRGYRSGISFYWGTGIAIGPVFFYSTFHWHDRHIVLVDRHHYHPYYHRHGGHDRYRAARRWEHDVYHRRDVIYDPRLRDRYSSRYRNSWQREGGNPRDYRRWERRDGFGGREGYRDADHGDRRDAYQSGWSGRSSDSDRNFDTGRDGERHERRQERAPSPGDVRERRPEGGHQKQFASREDGSYRHDFSAGPDSAVRNREATGTERRSGRPDPEATRQRLRDHRERSSFAEAPRSGATEQRLHPQQVERSWRTGNESREQRDSGERRQSTRGYRSGMEVQREERIEHQGSPSRNPQRDMPVRGEMPRERVGQVREQPRTGAEQTRPEASPRFSSSRSGEAGGSRQHSMERSSYGNGGRNDMRERRQDE